MIVALFESVPPAGWAALATVLGSLAGWLSTRHKSRAEVSSVLSETSIEWIHELRDDRARLRGELADLEDEHDRVTLDNSFLRRRGIALSARLRQEGIDPATVNGGVKPPDSS